MTLDEAIIHAEEAAREYEDAIGTERNMMYAHEHDKNCMKCAAEHRQLAEWLKDYKRLLAIGKGIDVRCGNCKHDGTGDGICEECFDYRRWEEI